MNTYKLFLALSLLTNPTASPSYETWPDVFTLAGWDSSLVSEAKTEYLFLAPVQYLGNLATTEIMQLQPASGYERSHAFLAPTLREIAIKLEIMDPREKSYLLQEAANFPQDVKQLQRRFQDLVDAPAATDAERFPDRESINELLSSNRCYRDELSQRLEIDHLNAAEIQQAIAEADQLHQVWNTLREARTGFLYVAARRQALKQLRELIGEPAFYGGELPPHLPVWRLPRVR